MKEIGGYIEFETYHGRMLHEDGILLNCGRSCLAYLIKAKKIKKIAIPYFMCGSVFNVCRKYNVQLRFYHVDETFRPEHIVLEKDEWIYLMNFYGQLVEEEIEKIGDKYERVIVDFAHDYFHGPIKGLDTLYTCRKFFGVSDGAVLYTDIEETEGLETDESFERLRYLCGRYERTASEFYTESSANNAFFDTEPVKKMSKLTKNLLRGIDYEKVKNQRTWNYALLHERLQEINQLNVRLVEGAYAYPFMIGDGEPIRKRLAERKIFIATLWPNVLEEMPKESLEYQLAKNILPLPCDHRYMEDDMKLVADTIQELVKE